MTGLTGLITAALLNSIWQDTLLAASIVLTAVVVTIAMFETLALLVS